jgi:hypothetical protein
MLSVGAFVALCIALLALVLSVLLLSPGSDVPDLDIPKNPGKRKKREAREKPRLATVYNESEPWLLRLARGTVVDMERLVAPDKEGIACKRLPSWRANEKRYIRLTSDRDRMKNCTLASGLPLTQRFGLRVAKDVLPTSHRQYRLFESEDVRGLPEELGRDADDVAWMLHEAMTSDPPLLSDDAATDQEWERWYSLVSVASSPLFMWGDATAVDADEDWREGSVGSVAELLRLQRLTFANDSRLQINTSAISVCPFNTEAQAMLGFDAGPFAAVGYELVHFMTAHAFAQHGWVSVPVAGSALGAVRHRGMVRGDDDMDLVTYAPAKFLWRRQTSFDDVYEDFDDVLEAYGAGADSNFSWFRTNDYRNNNRSLKQGPWATKRDAEKQLPPFSFVEYHHHIRQSNRVCAANYATWDLRERRRLFQTEACLANHVLFCLQPSQYLYRTHDETLERHLAAELALLLLNQEDADGAEMIRRRVLQHPGPMMFTAFHRRPLGKICRCRFGQREAARGFEPDDPAGNVWMLCPENLPDLVTYWYDSKWCVPSGAVQTRKWSFLKSWND